MADRRVKVTFSAEVQNYKAAMEAAAKSTEALKKASDDAGKATDQNSKKSEQSSQRSSAEIAKVATAHQAAATAAGLQYSSTGQLVTMNGKALSSQQAAAHGLQSFSQEAYLAGQAAVAAGEEAEAAAKATAEAEAKAAASAAKHRDSVERVGAAAAIAGAAVLAGVGMAVKSYADFDKQMSAVDAATHETAGNMGLLREAAIKAGADTAFSAGEAAQGIEELAKAGVSTQEILGGGLNGALALAAAGSLGVGDAAEIAATALTQFKLKGTDIPHVADLLAAGAGKAQGSVEDIGNALKQSGLVASQFGLSIEDTTGTLASFASAGLVGSDAGTSLKTMLLKLASPSKEAAGMMSDLGIAAYDAQGNFVGVKNLAGQLKDKLGGLSQAQRDSTLATIFGTDAIRGANVLYEQGADGIAGWVDKVNDAGFAADTAARKQDNLAGDLEKLGGSFDTVLIQSGSGANEVLRGLVQGLEGLVDVVGKVPAPVLGVATGLAAVVGGAALVGGALITVIPKIKETKDAFNELAPAGGKARNALEAVGKAAGVAAGLVAVTTVLAKLAEANYMSKIDTGMGRVNSSLADVAASSPGAASALDEIFKDRDGGELINSVSGIESAIKRTFNRDAGQQFNDWGESLVNGMTGVKGSSQILEDQFKSLDSGLASLVSSGKAENAAKAFDKIKEAAKNQGVTVEDLTKKFPAYADALKQADADAKNAGDGADKAAEGIKKAGGAADSAAPSAEDLAKQLEEVGLNADGSVASLDKFTTALVNAGLLTLSSRDATAKFDEALDGLDGKIRDIMATEQAHGGVLNKNKTDLDLYSDAGRAANDVLADMTQKGFGAAEAMAKNGESMPAVQGQLDKTYDAMVRTARGFGLGKDEAEALTRKILHIPPGVSVSSWMSSEAKRMAEQTKGALDNIDGRVVNTYANHHDTTFVNVVRSDSVQTGLGTANRGPVAYATGGRLPGFADGGQLPTSGPGTGMTDGFLGISSAGMPLARVDAGEWIINGKSSNRYNRELAAINAGTFPKLPGFASGGRAGDYAAQAFAARAETHITVQSVLKIGQREFAQAVSDSRRVMERN